MNKESIKNKLLDEVSELKDDFLEIKEEVKNKVIYSKLDSIPQGNASAEITKGCLVLEGGAFRAIYQEGVLDALMLNGINLSCVIGVSAGAMNGMNYVSGQIGRSARTNLSHRYDPRYVGVVALKNNKGLIGFNYVLDDINTTNPFNYERFNNPKQRFIAVATDCENGETRYFEKGKCSEIFKAIQASASMPYVSEMVRVENYLCLDGGCSCAIPYKWALDENYDRIVIIKTRTPEYRKPDKESKLALKRYGHHKEFAQVLANSNFAYNKQCEEIEQLKNSGRAFVIAPSKDLHIGRLEHDLEKLGEWYWLGYQDGLNALADLKQYLQK